MKKIKTYESFFGLKYNIGDYIKFNNKYVLKYIFAKIIDVNRASASYKCEIFFSDELSTEWLDSRHVERLMTPEEIENFEMKKNIKKYNL